ncbi:MAG: hypothetical protein ACE5FT_03005 [Candidatus Nanoarchaeia archaeon]
MDNCSYNLVKVIHQLTQLHGFLKKHCHKDAKKHPGCSKSMKALHNDVKKHMRQLQKDLAKHKF